MKIAIAGYGIEGESSYKYYSKSSENEIFIVDEQVTKIPEGTQSIIGPNSFDNLNGFDLVIRTPSLNPQKIKTDGKIWSATNEFFDKCPAKIIGVTGSKGKGTVASLIAGILEQDGKKVWLVGNIGQPALDILGNIGPEDIVVYELSSFQLWDIERSPGTAVILFIEQEHQDVHTSMDDYLNAKSNIVRFQDEGDLTIYNKNNSYSKAIVDGVRAKKVGYPDVLTAHFDNENFYHNEQKICSLDKLKLVGDHNKDNACAAIDAVWPLLKDMHSIERAFEKFKGLPHRLQFVRELNSIKYYDDSIATTPSSAIAALNAFDDGAVIILGGSSKGADFKELAMILKSKSAKALLIGDEANNIAKACDLIGFIDYEVIEFKDMPSLVKKAKDLARYQGVVLLSPASASFGLFKNYVDRGDKFQQAVMELK